MVHYCTVVLRTIRLCTITFARFPRSPRTGGMRDGLFTGPAKAHAASGRRRERAPTALLSATAGSRGFVSSARCCAYMLGASPEL